MSGAPGGGSLLSGAAPGLRSGRGIHVDAEALESLGHGEDVHTQIPEALRDLGGERRCRALPRARHRPPRPREQAEDLDPNTAHFTAYRLPAEVYLAGRLCFRLA